MKRLLAALLTLSMLVGIVPFSAFAESPGTVPETFAAAQESPGLYDETVQSIVSDPLLQGQYAPPQQAQPTVDTSNMSMEATDSFGRLLLSSIDEQNGTSDSANRVIGVTIDGSTATVEYVSTEDTDLVVAIYTDDSAEEMVASGTTAAPAMVENTGSRTAVVDISGTIPDYYTVKCFLLDKTEHAPLGEAYVSNKYTHDIVAIEEATVDDFPAERVVNLDEDPKTNFVVVAEGVVRAVEGENDYVEEENSYSTQANASFNIIRSIDDETQTYVIEHPSNRIKYLRSGQIFTLQYDGTNMLVTRVDSTEFDGDVITIHGNNDFDIGKAFDLLKLEEQTDGEKQYHYVEGSGDDALTYLGESVPEIEETNALDINLPFKLRSNFELFKAGALDGKISVGVNGKIRFYYSAGKCDILLQTTGYMNGSVTLDMTLVDAPLFEVPLGNYKYVPLPGIELGVEPVFKVKTTAKVEATLSLESTAGIEWKDNAYQNISKDPVIKFETELEGKFFVGLDLQPVAKIFKHVAEVSGTAMFGADMTFKSTPISEDTSKPSDDETKVDPDDWNNSPESKHLCKLCFTINTEFSATLQVTIKLVDKKFPSPDLKFPFTANIATGYWSVDNHDFSLFGGDCPYEGSRVVISIDGTDTHEGTTIYYSKDDSGSFSKLGVINSKGWLQAYLLPGTYVLSTTQDKDALTNDQYYAAFTVTDVPERIILRYATRSGECGANGSNLTWELGGGGVLTIRGRGEMQDYTEETPAPWPKDSVKGLDIQSGVTSIGDRAFADCTSLNNATIAGTVRRIGESAFSGCTSLPALDISIGTEEIGKEAFKGCTSLSSLKLTGGLTIWGGKVTRIEEETFADCSALTELTLPATVVEIGRAAFSGCTSLKTMALPDGVKSIPEQAFYKCGSLTSVSFANDLTELGVQAFGNCISLSSVNGNNNSSFNIPDTVTSIPQQAFAICRSLKRLHLPDSVTSIGDGAFLGCSGATEIDLPANLESIGDYAFQYCTSVKGKQEFTPSGSYAPITATGLSLPATLTFIGDHAFEGCTLLDGIEFKGSLAAIGSFAFKDCTSLSAAALPTTLQYLGQAVFSGCTSLVTVEVPHNIYRIAVSTFNGCTALKYVTLPGSTELIADSAFKDCTALEMVTYKGDLADWFKVQVEDNNEPLDDVIVHCDDADTKGHHSGTSSDEEIVDSGTCGDNLTWELNQAGTLTISGTGKTYNFGDYNMPSWYSYRSDIKAVIVDDGVTALGSYIFFKHFNLTSISLPDSVTSIGKDAFAECSSLVNIIIPDSVSDIAESAFWSCSSLTSINLPDGISHIPTNAFGDCPSLSKISIPSSVKSISNSAFFFNCATLGDVYYSGTKNMWAAITIDSTDNESLYSATIHCSDGDIVGTALTPNTIASGTCGDNLTWTMDNTGILTISGTGPMEDYSNDSLPPWYFYGYGKVVINDGVTAIGNLNFISAPIVSISIPDSITSIGDSAFISCVKLYDISLPSNITNIGASAFLGCDLLKSISLPASMVTIGRETFCACNSLEVVSIPTSITTIESAAFFDSPLKDIYYSGTKAMWSDISIDDTGDGNAPLHSATIHCTDGDILPASTVSSEENSISASTATGDDHSFAASFSDLTPGVSYAVIVSRSENDPLAPENLIYINQFRASSSDYQQSFQTPRSSTLTADDMTYVIASGIYSFDETPTPTPGGGSSSGGSSSGGGGGGGGAAVLIGVGAAAAITAGVIMMSPVEIKGRVELADQTAVPGAKLSLLREGKVVAQTTADENGSFSLKAKRGSYELTAAYTNADGQLIYKTIDIKAPAKDLTVTF